MKKYTVEDLLKWLKAEGFTKAVEDIERMQTDTAYAKKVWYDEESDISLYDLLLGAFRWEESVLGHEHWNTISSKLHERE